MLLKMIMKTLLLLAYLCLVSSAVQNYFSNVDLAQLAAADGVTIIGGQTNGYSGFSVTGVGDINGDHLDDVLIGAYNDQGAGRLGAGQAYIIYGTNVPTISFNLSALLPSQGFKITGPIPNGQAGYKVSKVGDVDGDGYNDFAIAVFNYNYINTRSDNGCVYVLFGGTTMTNIDLNILIPSQGYIIIGALDQDNLGLGGLAFAGDVNNDGRPDLVMVAGNGGSTNKAVYVVYGRGRGVTTIDLATVYAGSNVNGFVILNTPPSDQSGSCVSGGNVNGDRFSDIIIGSSLASPLSRGGAGIVYVIYGKSGNTNINMNNGLTPSQGYLLYGAHGGDGLGFAVAGLQDTNGDGVADLVIGANGYLFSKSDRSGAAYVLFGDKSNTRTVIDLIAMSSSVGFRMQGNSGDQNGFAVADAGDINGDGLSEILVGAVYASPLDRFSCGMTYLVFGRRTGHSNIDLGTLSYALGYSISGASSSAQSGFSVAGAGDFNGDGYGDLLIGAPYTVVNNKVNVGSSYVVYGKATPTPTSQPSSAPSVHPSARPSLRPLIKPTSMPSTQPSSKPSGRPSYQPTSIPTSRPTLPLLHVDTYFTIKNTDQTPLSSIQQTSFEKSIETILPSPIYVTYRKTPDSVRQPDGQWTVVIDTRIWLPMVGFMQFYGNNSKLIDYGKGLLNKSFKYHTINQVIRTQAKRDNITAWWNVTVSNLEYNQYTRVSSDAPSDKFVGNLTFTQFLIMICILSAFVLFLIVVFVRYYLLADAKNWQNMMACGTCAAFPTLWQQKPEKQQKASGLGLGLGLHMKSEDLGDTSHIDYDQNQYSYPGGAKRPNDDDEDGCEMDTDHRYSVATLEMDKVYGSRNSKFIAKPNF